MAGPVLQGDELIGLASVVAGEHGAELGYFIARPLWGNGYATEISRALVAHGFDRYSWSEITAGVFEGNPASDRVLDKLGFTFTGWDEEDCKARGARFPIRVYTLTRKDWERADG